MTIKVLDSVMGSGKSTYIRNYINQNPNQKYIYISLYLKEAKEAVNECNVDFKEPAEEDENGVKCLKLDNLHKLLKNGYNIASTHALFKHTTAETIEYLKKWNYTLVIDEVVQVISLGDVKKKVLETAQKLNLVEVDPKTKRLIWKNKKENYRDIPELQRLKIMCKADSVFLWESKDKRKKSILVSIFPQLIFEHFKDVYICTYKFESCPMKLYFDMYNMPYEKYMIIGKETGNYQMVPYRQKNDGLEYKDRFNIYLGPKNTVGMNVKGEGEPLSAGWFQREYQKVMAAQKDNPEEVKDCKLDILRRNIYGYYTNDLNSPVRFNMWTCLLGDREDGKKAKGKYQKFIEGKRFASGFTPCNLRATDAYSNKEALVFAVNIFVNPVITAFFGDQRVKIAEKFEDQYALSEFLQWCWRSAIRRKDFTENINVYIPSSRMRWLFQKWLGQPKAN